MTDAADRTLRDLNPTGRFSDRAEDYARFRPSYPPEAIDALLQGLGDPASLVAADIGAGTGISARLLADRGVRVIAVEPNTAMRAAAAAHPRVEFVDATAERTGLPDAGVDLVVCAQAFHWFEPAAALAEFARILRPGGRLALVWNERDDSSAATAAYGAAIRATATVDPDRVRLARPEALEASPLFTRVRRAWFRNAQRLDRRGLIGRARSASYAPKAGPAHERLLRLLGELHDRFARGGEVELVYRTLVVTGEKA